MKDRFVKNSRRKQERINSNENLKVRSVGSDIAYLFQLVNLSPGGLLATPLNKDQNGFQFQSLCKIELFVGNEIIVFLAKPARWQGESIGFKIVQIDSIDLQDLKNVVG